MHTERPYSLPEQRESNTRASSCCIFIVIILLSSQVNIGPYRKVYEGVTKSRGGRLVGVTSLTTKRVKNEGHSILVNSWCFVLTFIV